LLVLALAAAQKHPCHDVNSNSCDRCVSPKEQFAGLSCEPIACSPKHDLVALKLLGAACGYPIGFVERGWPLAFSKWRSILYENINEDTAARAADSMEKCWPYLCIKGKGYAIPEMGEKLNLLTPVFIVDLLIAISILITMAVLSEWLIRRREDRNSRANRSN
jgi:hypothetical protein